jgi:GT2 family glycosyltransferase
MVSIIIVNWNGERFLKDCFNSLSEQTFMDFEIIFVDNASTDGSLSLAKKLASHLNIDVKFIELDRNKGFAGGNNEGFKNSTRQYIALLNTDTVADKNWLKSLIETMDSHPQVGICASKLIVTGENVIDSAGDGYSTFGHAFKRGEGGSTQDFSIGEFIFGACAGAALYRREMIDYIGLFDEDFFLIFEDTDLNFRAQLSGWKCFYVSEATVYHKVGGNMKKLPAMAAYYSVRNDKFVKIKNIPLSIIIYKIPTLIIGEFIWFIYYLINGKFRYYLKANIDVVKNLPLCFKKRRETLRLKKISSSYINSLLTSGFKLYSLRRITRYLA